MRQMLRDWLSAPRLPRWQILHIIDVRIEREYNSIQPDRKCIQKLALARRRAIVGWPYLIRLPGLALIIGMLSYSIVQAADWQVIRHQCVEEIEKQYACTSGCVNRLWPEMARCTNARAHLVPPMKLDACIPQIKQTRAVRKTPELVGDPVAEALSCAGG